MHAQCEPISAPEHGQTDPVQSEAVQARAPFVKAVAAAHARNTLGARVDRTCTDTIL